MTRPTTRPAPEHPALTRRAVVFGAGGLVGVGEDPAAEGHLAAMCMKKKTAISPMSQA